MNRFVFIDSSGIIKQDKFFGVGLLVMRENIGDLVNKLSKTYQAAQSIVKINKDTALNQLLKNERKDEVIKILHKNKRFEMKFDNVRPSTKPYYKRMVDVFFSDRKNRFSAMVIDKEKPGFDANLINDTWEAYTGYSTSLVVREVRNLKDDKLCLIIDEITKPHNKPFSLEETFIKKLKFKITKDKDKDLNLDNIFGVLSIESHSNILMQLTDILLGAVIYDFKKKNSLTSINTEKRKEDLVKDIRKTLGINNLAQDFTKHSPAYFSVFEARWDKTKNNTQ